MIYIVWDSEIGIRIGSILIRYYSLMYFTSAVIGYLSLKYIWKKEKIATNTLDYTFLYFLIGLLLGGRLGHVLFYQPELFLESPLSVFLPISMEPTFRYTGFQGMASHGATIGALISAYFIHTKLNKPILWISDRVSPLIVLSCGFVRIGNFFNSEILGKPFDGDWAVLFVNQYTFYGQNVPRHPSMLYESAAYFLIFFISCFLYLKTDIKEKSGKIFLFSAASYFITRFFIEFTKEPQGNEVISAFGLNSGQILSVLALIFMFFLYFFSKKTQSDSPNFN